MDLNKKLKELKPQQLNCNVFDVYSYNGLTMQDLLCQFFTTINECVKSTNDVIDLTDWLVNVGLEEEVVKKLMTLIEDGTVEELINVNLFKTLNNEINTKANIEDVARISSGTPLFASSINEMTDITRNYVNTNDGYLYIYSDGSWVKTIQYQTSGLDYESVTMEDVNFIVTSKNLFDKNDNNIIDGYFINSAGIKEVNSQFYISHKINVKKGDTITIKIGYSSAGGYYDKTGKWLGKFGTTSGNQSPFSFTVNTDDVDYILVNGLLSNKETDMIVKSNEYPGEYIEFKNTLSDKIDISEKVKNNIIDEVYNNIPGITSTPQSILSELNNPFVKTKIKLLGDSITHGVGGTGFAQDGDKILLDWYINTNGYCWANELKKYIENKYNKNTPVSFTNDNIVINGYNSIMNDTNTLFGEQLFFVNTTSYHTEITFKTSGNKVGIYYTKLNQGGEIDIYSNDLKIGTIDTYSPTTLFKQLTTFENLGEGEKTIKIKSTGTRNENSTNTKIFLEGLDIYKIAKVENYGMAGSSFDWILRGSPTSYLEQVIKSDDKIIIVELGTNDRDEGNNPKKLEYNVDKFIKKLKEMGKTVIMMSACPATLENEQTKTVYHMEDVDNILRMTCIENNVSFISNYQYFIDYCDKKNIDMNSLFPDKLHPNDEGYSIMLKGIMKELGFAQKIEGATW